MNNIEALKQLLSQEDTVLFIGAGISRWSGLPSWQGLIEELAKFVSDNGGNPDLIRNESARGDLLQAASYGFDQLTKPQIGDFIRRTCRYGAAVPHAIHQQIVALGPRCFITTNYDDLLEQALRRWQPDRFYRPAVTNRHLTELAEIVHARAIDFVFKPHGDAGDTESIVLTREQYRLLLPQGERHAAAESLKTLLVSRPVVYLGFGLRDPDFSYIRDLLANTYKGATRDHYAIMSDISGAERDYWRRQYGIHLLSYETTEGPNSTRDHSALLRLLDSLTSREPPTTASEFDPSASEVVLSLARHAAQLARVPQADPEFQIRVHTTGSSERKKNHSLRLGQYYNWPIDRFLDEGPHRAVLVGSPGAGKTYSLRRASARLAEDLHQACVQESFDPNNVVVPLLADLKFYEGNLYELVNQTLPKSLALDALINNYEVKIFLDSFNEMPREYWENGAYELDFSSFLNAIGDASLVIGSRTSDGLLKLELPEYKLDQIDEKSVAIELDRRGIEIQGRFTSELWDLLQRPFYFQQIIKGFVQISGDMTPRDFYASLMKIVRTSFKEKFLTEIDIEKVLSLAAYVALNRGEEAFPLTDLQRALEEILKEQEIENIDLREIINWLVSSSILIAHKGGRVTFVHQSITEYLAASELARRYEASAVVLNEKLHLNRWDQALFITLSILPSEKAIKFFEETIKADFVLALRASKYLESGRDVVIGTLLGQIPERLSRNHIAPEDEREIGWVMNTLPVSLVHESPLRAIMNLRDSLGGSAAAQLIQLKGPAIKQEMLDLLVEARGDYNFCANGIAPSLEPMIDIADLYQLANLADSISEEVTTESKDEVAHGFTAASATLFDKFSISVVREILLPKNNLQPIPEIRARIMKDILWRRHTTAALDLAGEMLLRGFDDAATSIFFIVNFAQSSTELSLESVRIEHVERLIELLDVSGPWALRALRSICDHRPDLKDIVRRRLSSSSLTKRTALLYCTAHVMSDAIFANINKLLALDSIQLEEQPLHLFEQMRLDWKGRESLLIEILRLRNVSLGSAILSPIYSQTFGDGFNELDLSEIDWLLEWLHTLNTKDDEQDWFRYMLGRVIASNVNEPGRGAFLNEFNNPASKFRHVLLESILPHLSDITTDSLTDDSISFLLSDLQRKSSDRLTDHILGEIATEPFVVDRLLPLLRESNSPFREKLYLVLKQSGARHGRRYVFDELP
jgi:hypothetical protein